MIHSGTKSSLYGKQLFLNNSGKVFWHLFLLGRLKFVMFGCVRAS